MAYQSRFGLTPDSLSTGVHAAEELKHESRRLCNPCQEGDRSRCPTALHEQGVFISDFDCPCYEDDPYEHEEEARGDDWIRGEFEGG